jgi:hypothetical protein
MKRLNSSIKQILCSTPAKDVESYQTFAKSPVLPVEQINPHPKPIPDHYRLGTRYFRAFPT